ncbi:hypothetical protein CV103_05765 [Sphingomonas fennica]|uniref:Uncharacterized protein n=1 Tax=Edaphosphingomonas fennica TaxID=114404 RepID=A0A2T4I5J0_9SPHN|nr:hypothetical protein CV103_05765 [Sphingomonas fennica]
MAYINLDRGTGPRPKPRSSCKRPVGNVEIRFIQETKQNPGALLAGTANPWELALPNAARLLPEQPGLHAGDCVLVKELHQSRAFLVRQEHFCLNDGIQSQF